MIRLVISLLAAIAIQTECFAEITKLPAKDWKALQNSAQFHEVHSVTNLPTTIITLCADRNGRLADRGQKWEVTDVITDSSFPQKRLIWAVTNGEYFVVHYERGGYAHSFHVLVATLKSGENKPVVVWRGIGSELKDFNTFVDALNKKDLLDDKLDYAH